MIKNSLVNLVSEGYMYNLRITINVARLAADLLLRDFSEYEYVSHQKHQKSIEMRECCVEIGKGDNLYLFVVALLV